jgi:anthranilate synthase component 1
MRVNRIELTVWRTDAGGMEQVMNLEESSLNLDKIGFFAAVARKNCPVVIPLTYRIHNPGISPVTLYAALLQGQGFLLESGEGPSHLARYSVIGVAPILSVTLGAEPVIEGEKDLVKVVGAIRGGDAVDQMRTIQRRIGAIEGTVPKFSTGLVGYFPYEGVALPHTRCRQGAMQCVDTPASTGLGGRFMLAGAGVVVDHLDGTLTLFVHVLHTSDRDPHVAYRSAKASLAQIARVVREVSDADCEGSSLHEGSARVRNVMSETTKEDFCDAVARVREHIFAGDIFQAVISRRFSGEFTGDPISLYRALRVVNPSPYLYLLDFGDEVICGASPEMLVGVEKGRVTTVPIAGTRPRGRDQVQDEMLATDLMNDEKERAEHTMLVDLARNDIGRVCRFGSVHVDNFMEVMRFSHVQHLVSTVTGDLRDDCDALDAFTSCFPAGTVSGAPKVRAMEIIRTIEGCSRGVYAGAVGYAGFDGTLEFAIAIRTAVIRSGRIEVQAGAGIVADSVPVREWEETGDKAQAIFTAIERAGMVG